MKRSNVQLTAQDLSRIAGMKIFFGHQSVGGNVVQVIPEVYAAYGVIGINMSGGITTGANGFFADEYNGNNGDPVDKNIAFAVTIRGGVEVVAFFKYCYVDINDDMDIQALFNHFSSTMSALEQGFPAVKFLYATNSLATADSADNVARERYNQLIRQRYGNTGRSFDIALAEPTTPSGSRTSAIYNGSNYYTLYTAYSSDGGHLSVSGRHAVARYLLTVIANATR